ncbi:hypothetical protein HanOQP8_Chr14g0509141 [Helianthus annuus]|nr:hypothetical protein HanOQP8_Chr14g0509141 [Helianthus annuus]
MKMTTKLKPQGLRFKSEQTSWTILAIYSFLKLKFQLLFDFIEFIGREVSQRGS